MTLVELNALESKRFGIVAARLTDPTAPLDAVDAAAQAADVDMLTTRVDVGDLPRVHALEHAGYQLMDTLVYYDRVLEDNFLSKSTTHDLNLRVAVPKDADDASQLARQGFRGYFGHYHTDPRLDNTAADAAYVEWAERSLKHLSNEAPVLLAEMDGQVAGFLTMCLHPNSEMELVLSAVSSAFSGKGLYSAMIAEALPLSKQFGAHKIITSTQINNYAVQRVWSRLGFCHSKSLYTFHKWYDP